MVTMVTMVAMVARVAMVAMVTMVTMVARVAMEIQTGGEVRTFFGYGGKNKKLASMKRQMVSMS